MNIEEPSCTVFIWYPFNKDIGHCSLYIGNYMYAVLAIDEMIMTIEQLRNFQELNSTQLKSMNWYEVPNYVSWWPSDGHNKNKLMTQKVISAKASNGIIDCLAEGAPPHVTYTVFGLDTASMQTEWVNIKNKYNGTGGVPSYHLLRKNCATVVYRVLKAGGIEGKLGSSLGFYGKVWTPRAIAVACNSLRDKGMAKKEKHMRCPRRSSRKMMTFLGLR